MLGGMRQAPMDSAQNGVWFAANGNGAPEVFLLLCGDERLRHGTLLLAGCPSGIACAPYGRRNNEALRVGGLVRHHELPSVPLFASGRWVRRCALIAEGSCQLRPLGRGALSFRP